VSRLRIFFGCLAAALAAPVFAATQEPPELSPDNVASMSFEDLMRVRIETVYGASKYEQKVTRAPSSVTVLTAEDIARFGHRTLAEALRSIRGLYVSNDRNYSYLGIRGFLRPGDYNSRVLVLIDGHRMNDNIYDAAYFGQEGLLAVDVIERVEFVRGPSSSIYGSSAFFGIINIVTKQGQALGSPELAVGLGSLGERNGRFSYGQLFQNDMEVSVTGGYYSSDGHDRLYYPEFDPALSNDVRATNGGFARDLDREESFGGMATLKRGDFTLSTSVLSRTKEVPTASFGTAFNSLERTTDHRGFATLKYEHEFAPDLHLQGRLSYDRYAYYGDYLYDYDESGDPSSLVPNKDNVFGNWLGTEWQVTRVVSGRHTFVGGFEYRENLKQRQFNFDDTLPRSYTVDDDRTSHNAALFGQAEVAVTSTLLLNAGLRYDYYADSFGGTYNPRIGFIYSPSERATLKLLYGEAFRAPSVYERFYYAAEAPQGRSLGPETIRTTEVAWEQYIGQRTRIDVSVYRYEVSGLITQLADEDGNIYFDNLTQVTADGIELEGERRFESGGALRASYALQRTRDSATGRSLTSSPRHLAKLNFGLPLGGYVEAGLELQYYGRMRTLVGAETKDFVIGNLSLSSDRLPYKLHLAGTLSNLFNVRYGYPGAEDHLQDVIEQDGRTLHLTLSRRF
jgi:iron complex outermembrane receptor protein